MFETTGHRIAAVAILAVLSMPVAASADEHLAPPPRWHAAGWYAAGAWPAIEDLTPVTGGSFQSPVLGFGVSLHRAFRDFAESRLLLGFEAMIEFGGGDVPLFIDDRLHSPAIGTVHLFAAASAKWQLGKNRAASLDAGLGAHVAAVNNHQNGEFDAWRNNAVGPFVGASWDVGGHRGDRGYGLFVAIRAHFVDFGQVADQPQPTRSFVALGSDAGRLDGPIYLLQIGISNR